jgi:predicted permease
MRPAGIRRLFRFPTRSSNDVRRDVDDELSFHLEMRMRDLIAEGWQETQAREQALREFGDVRRSVASLTRHDERVERRRGLGRFASELRQDVAYGLRLLRRDKGFSTAAVLTLAVAIGGNAAMFSVVNAMFLRPLPIRAPGELARIRTGESTVSWPNLDDLRQRNTVFTSIVAQGQAAVSLTIEPLPVRLAAGLVSPDYFSELGTAPLMGRTPQPGDRRPDVVVLSERLWRARFAGSPSIVGQSITIDGRRKEIVAVMPRAFNGLAPAGLTRDLWMPLDLDGVHRGIATDRSATRFEAFGRLRPGTSIDEARAAMRVLGEQLAQEHPATNERFRAMEVFPASGIGLYRGMAKTLMPLFGFIGFMTVVAGFVLFVSCANLAGLLLGRAAARKPEIAVRLSLGAGRGRLIRQLLTESLIIAVAGGALGLALAATLTSELSRAVARLPMPIDLNLVMDLRVVAYTLAISVACAMLFGLAPARRASRVSLVDSLKADAAGGPARQRFRQALIVAQVAVSALLLFWSGLFARSLLHASSVETGFDPSDVLLAEVTLADDAPGALQRADAAFVDLHDRVRQIPGVEAVGWSSIVPLALTGNERFRVSTMDAPQAVPGHRVVASRLSPGWFDAVRIPFVAGRDFTWQDRLGSPPVVIINQTLARQLFNGAALGQQLRYGDRTLDIVGIVRDSKYWTLGESTSPTVYLPFRQVPALFPPTLHVRTSDPRGTAERIRREVRTLVPGSAPQLQLMRDAVAVAVVPARVGAAITGGFGLLGALLATMGVYGLISYIVVQRTREMAIRRALGAPSTHIVRVVIGGNGILAAVGLALGIGLGALTAPMFGGLLVNVSPTDPLTIVATTAVVLTTAIAASARPAWRAARLNPLSAMKTC